MDPKVYFKGMAVMKNLPQMYRELNELKKRVEELSGNK